MTEPTNDWLEEQKQLLKDGQSSECPTCPVCGEKLTLLSDPKGIYGVCFRYGRCTERVHVKTHAKYYQVKYNPTKFLGRLRHQAHLEFDKLWKEYGMSRKEAYKILQKIMRLSEEKAHISKFNEEQCNYLIKLCKEYKDMLTIYSSQQNG
tara:strand:- start:202 stop:651 length:450 start_codon:yes stop_codon:yes gene_type:complete